MDESIDLLVSIPDTHCGMGIFHKQIQWKKVTSKKDSSSD